MGTSKGYIPPKNKEWKKAKAAVTRMINNNEKSLGIKSAVSEYAKAYSSTHLGNSKLGAVSGNVIGFLLNAKQYGLDKALLDEGLDFLVGKPTDEIYIGLTDYFCTDNSTIDESVIRDCIVEIFTDNNIVDFEDLDKLDGNILLQNFIIKYIQINFEVAFTEKIYGVFENQDKAKFYIKDVKQYIDDTIRNLYEMDELLGINWRGKEGQDFINKKCKECYELIQAFEEV